MIFDFESKEIQNLNDTDLRSLIGLLCEAELKKLGLSSTYVTYGGNQTAPDGGVDARVSIDINVTSEKNINLKNSYIKCNETIFQVKKPNMPVSEIEREMKKDGKLKDSIKEVVENGGAYIIVSSGSSTSDSELKKRIDCMKNIIKDYGNGYVDFYDCARIRTWSKNYPYCTLWLQEKLGKNNTRPFFCNWQELGNEEFFLDNKNRFFFQTDSDVKNMLDGINKLRQMINQKSSQAIRLIGLSGVGKTRFLRALFDEKIGENALDISNAVYLGEENYDSIKVLLELAAIQQKSILIVDNCSSKIHKQLVDLLGNKSMVKIITVEYDVQEDFPENTLVVRIEPASNELVKNIIKQKTKNIDNDSIDKIVAFSEGNIRVALILAEAYQKGGNTTVLNDRQLLERLFYQRDKRDENLQKAAEVCSLVYSFNEEEIYLLAEKLININKDDMHRYIQMLKNREILRNRGSWYSLLPASLANKLAKEALKNIRIQKVVDFFQKTDNNRLLLSFTRRIGYLHDSEKVQEIVDKWFEDDFNDVSESCKEEVLYNISAVFPEKTLECIKQYVIKNVYDDKKVSKWTKDLMVLSYYENLFKDAFELILDINCDTKIIKPYLLGVFSLTNSITQAGFYCKLEFIQNMIATNEEIKLDKAFCFLQYIFKDDNCFDIRFGARKTTAVSEKKEDIIVYKSHTLEYILTLANSNSLLVSKKAKKFIVDNLHEFLVSNDLFRKMITIIENINDEQLKIETLYAVKQLLNSEKYKEQRTIETKKVLQELEKNIRPDKLKEKIMLYIMMCDKCKINYEQKESYFSRNNKLHFDIQKVGKDYGKQLWSDKVTLEILLPYLLKKMQRDEHSIALALQYLGIAFGENCDDKQKWWDVLKEHIGSIRVEDRRIHFCAGF